MLMSSGRAMELPHEAFRAVDREASTPRFHQYFWISCNIK